MSFVKLLILFANTVLTWRALTPMTAVSRPAEGDIAKRGGTEGIIGCFVPQLGKILKYQFTIAFLCEAAFILGCGTFSTLLATCTTDGIDIGTTNTFLVGTTFIACGAFLRVACYRTLGNLFTLQLMVRKGHRLVTTGPYAYVRHPSYTALFCIFVGTGLVALGPGSLAVESGWLKTGIGRAYVAVWVILRGISIVNLVGRTRYEDAFLKERFGEEWEAWAKTTRYKMLSGVY